MYRAQFAKVAKTPAQARGGGDRPLLLGETIGGKPRQNCAVKSTHRLLFLYCCVKVTIIMILHEIMFCELPVSLDISTLAITSPHLSELFKRIWCAQLA